MLDQLLQPEVGGNLVGAAAALAVALVIVVLRIRAARAKRRVQARQEAERLRELESREAYVRDNPIVDCPECRVRARHLPRDPEHAPMNLHLSPAYVARLKTTDPTGLRGFSPCTPRCRREHRGREHRHFWCRSCQAEFSLAEGFVQDEILAELARHAEADKLRNGTWTLPIREGSERSNVKDNRQSPPRPSRGPGGAA